MNIRPNNWLHCLLLISFLLSACKLIAPSEPTPATEASTALTLSLVQDSARSRYQPLEFSIEGMEAVSNPFDASEADLQLWLTGPNGITTTVGGFWYQGYTPNGAKPNGKPTWRARFTPTSAGEWHASAQLNQTQLNPNGQSSGGQSSNELTFSVAEAATPGFVRIDPTNPRFFAFDDGTRFIPIGVNMGWWNDDPIENYTRWLDHFAANGGNTIRVWMASWAFALEWNDTGLGDYSPRMQQAWLLDELFRLADERGIKVILVLNHHGQFSKTVNPQWDDNPYNTATGGPLTAPEQFASDPTAIAFFQQRLRYIVDRWGAAPNLLAWEWWNEYNFTTIDDAHMQTWLQTMDTYLSSSDPNNHLVTISGPAGAASPIWQMEEIDFVSVHIYTTNDPLTVATELTDEYAPLVPDKPLLLAEYGYATGEEGVNSNDKTGIHLHNGLWATLFNGQAGSGMYWWWDTYIEPLNLWHHYGALATFFTAIDISQFTPSPIAVIADNPKGAGAEATLLKGTSQHLLWIRSNQYTAAAVDEAYNLAVRNAIRNKEKLEEFIYTPSSLTNLRVQINDIEAGRYTIHWFDPQSGTWGEVEQIEAVNGALLMPLPTFNQDIAAKIERIP